MKKVKIGNIEGNLCESTGDIWDLRWTYFKIYMYRVLEYAEQPLFAATYGKVIDHLNKGKGSQAAIELADYYKSLQLREDTYDSMSLCFALIFLEEGENQANVDENFLGEKLQRLQQEGLSRGFVEESVMAFTERSLSISSEWKARLETITMLSSLSD